MSNHSQQKIKATITNGQTIQAKAVGLGPALSLSSLSDVNVVGASDGALLIYNGTSKQFVANTQLENSNTLIIGGSF